MFPENLSHGESSRYKVNYFKKHSPVCSYRLSIIQSALMFLISLLKQVYVFKYDCALPMRLNLLYEEQKPFPSTLYKEIVDVNVNICLRMDWNFGTYQFVMISYPFSDIYDTCFGF